CITAPVGSFSWALIQLKLRKRVARSVWGDKGMYLAITPRVNELTVEEGSAYAVDGVAIGTKYDYLTHIDLHNEYGNFVPWQPAQEDMMACDWELRVNNSKIPDVSEPSYYSLVFDVTPNETSKGSLWGGSVNSEIVVVENEIGDNAIFSIYWYEKENGIPINLGGEYTDFMKVVADKKLTVTVDGTKYHLGYRIQIEETPVYIPLYQGDDAEKLGNLLKQTGKTYRFHLNWHD
ncbi:DUF2829 domain-containing protein, partial [Xenorhabdus sp. Reich]